jgi:glycine oxidase
MAVCDVLIVGGGLAGTSLAWHLVWAGQDVRIVDRGEPRSSSRVAAGLVTPITGKRLAKTPHLDVLHPFAVDFYDRVAAAVGRPVYHHRGTVRLFTDDAEQHRYAERADTEFAGWARTPTPRLSADEFEQPFGGFEMPKAGQLLVRDYLNTSAKYFGPRYCQTVVSAEDCVPTADGVRVESLGLVSQYVVFCEGFLGTVNPWFPHVVFNAAKGAILTVRVPLLGENRVVNRGGFWMIPEATGIVRCGATYDRQRLDSATTGEDRDELTTRLAEVLRLPFSVVDHQAAVRPIISNRRPTMLFSDRCPRIGFFNGLSSKGALFAPWYAAGFAEAIVAGRGIDSKWSLGAESLPAEGG